MPEKTTLENIAKETKIIVAKLVEEGEKDFTPYVVASTHEGFPPTKRLSYGIMCLLVNQGYTILIQPK